MLGVPHRDLPEHRPDSEPEPGQDERGKGPPPRGSVQSSQGKMGSIRYLSRIEFNLSPRR